MTTNGKKGVLYVGIDLGTMRTSVAASNGVRETDFSYVGYPRDVVAKKLFKREQVFGKEALKKRMGLDLVRPFEHGFIKYGTGHQEGARGQGGAIGATDGTGHGALTQADLEKHLQAAKDLVKYTLQLAKPRKDELVYGVLGAPAQASIDNKRLLVDATKGTLDAVMVCSEPFAVAYGLEMLDDTLVIDIGAGTVDLCRMHGTMPCAEDQLTLNTAGDWIDQQVFARFKHKFPEADFSIHQVKEIKDKYAFVNDVMEPVIAEFLVRGKPTKFDVTNELRDACRQIVPPIVKGIQQLVSSFDPDFQHQLREHVLLAGGGSQIIGLDRVLEEFMRRTLGSGTVRRVDEPVYAGCNGALKMAQDMPEEYWKRLS